MKLKSGLECRERRYGSFVCNETGLVLALVFLAGLRGAVGLSGTVGSPAFAVMPGVSGGPACGMSAYIKHAFLFFFSSAQREDAFSVSATPYLVSMKYISFLK